MTQENTGESRPAEKMKPRGRHLEAASLLSQAVETSLLPPERFKEKPPGEVVDIKKINETIAVLEKVSDHYEASIYDARGKRTQIIIDPNTHEFIDHIIAGIKADSFKGNDTRFYKLLKINGYPEETALKLEKIWYEKAQIFINRPTYKDYGYVGKADLLNASPIILPAGEWKISSVLLDNATKGFLFIGESGKTYAIPSKSDFVKSNLNVSDIELFNPDLIKTSDKLNLRKESTLFRIEDKSGLELASYSGSHPCVDPTDPDSLFFINTGRVYRLDLTGAATRGTRPELQDQIKVTDPQEIHFEPNGNFLIIRTGDQKLQIIDKQTGDVVKSLNDVKGPVLVDEQGDINYIATDGFLRELQTNFQAVPKGGSEQAIKHREEELKLMQERFKTLELKKVERQKGNKISEQDVAETLRETISRQVTDKINAAKEAEEVEDVLDRLQGLKADPANQGFGEVIDEFIAEARDKLSHIKTAEFDIKLSEFQQNLDSVKSVGDTIGLDQESAELMELRQSLDITDPQKRRELDTRLQKLQTKKDALNNQYQDELVETANQTLPQIIELLKETGSPQELAFFSTSTQAQQFEMIMINIKDPKVRKELRDKYSAARNQHREKLDESSKQLAEQDRLRWAQIVEEAREDLDSLKESIEELSDAKEIDRFGRHPLVTAWKAKLYTLPPELRDIEEKKLELILGARKKDMEHRKELGAIGDAGELKFGNSTFPIYKEPPMIWQPKLIPRKGGFSELADLIFEDAQGRVWRPEEHDVVVNSDMTNEITQRQIERYRKAADEYFKGIKRRVPDFDEHWRITDFHMAKLEEITEALKLQLDNHRGILILQGEAGTGKNVVIDILANLSNRQVIPVLCNENSVKEDLTYEFYYDPEKGTYKLPSKLVEGIQSPGTIVLFDEINALKPGIAKLMNSLFDYRRRIYLPEGGKDKELITDPTVLFIGTMNPQNYAGVNRLSPEVKSRARVVDLEYPQFEDDNTGRTLYKSDEAEMLAAYMDSLDELNQKEFKLCWNYVVNRDTTNGAEMIIQGNPGLEQDIRRIQDVIRVASRLRKMYEDYQTGEANEPMDFPTSLREVTDIVMEMNHRQGVKEMIIRVIVPKIDDRRQKKLVLETINALLPS